MSYSNKLAKRERFEIIICWSEEDQVFIADIPESPGCMAHGNTYEEALNSAKDAAPGSAPPKHPQKVAMRLAEKEIAVIRETVLGFDREAQIYLFGSCADDRSRGGDIDLLIASDRLTARDRRKIRLELYDRLGEQKIDIVLAQNASAAFVRLAKEEGVRL